MLSCYSRERWKFNLFQNSYLKFCPLQTRMDHNPTDSVLDWSGYIDQGKQMSILHSLLVENFPKLPPQKQNEMAQLTSILERISQIKESTENNYQRHLSEQNFASMEKLNGHKSSMGSLHISSNQPSGERGIMRGVLTPNSLQKNIVSVDKSQVFPPILKFLVVPLVLLQRPDSLLASQRRERPEDFL